MSACYNRTHSKSSRGTVYRSSTDKVAAGVCGGLAAHFDISATWLRVGFVVSCLFSFPLPLILYVVCIFVMPKEGSSNRRSHTNAPPKYRSRDEALSHLCHEFDGIEGRIRELEDHVTSKEYVLKRKFDDL